MSFARLVDFSNYSFVVKTVKLSSRDISKILGTIKCGPTTKGGNLPKDYNSAVMKVKRQFEEEVKHRQTGKEYSISLSHGQRYVLRELRLMFSQIEFEDKKSQINILEKAFRGCYQYRNQQRTEPFTSQCNWLEIIS